MDNIITYIGKKDKHGNEIKIGDILKVKVQRLSSSTSSWYKETNLNHVNFYIKMIVYWDDKNLQVKLKPFDEKEIEELKKPIGKERNEQVILYPTTFYCYCNIDAEDREIIKVI